jgi:hypothetical protein
MLYLGSIACSMLSISLLIVRIVKLQKLVWVPYAIAAAICVWGLVGVLLFAFQCPLPCPWDWKNQLKYCVGGLVSVDKFCHGENEADVSARSIYMWDLLPSISRLKLPTSSSLFGYVLSISRPLHMFASQLIRTLLFAGRLGPTNAVEGEDNHHGCLLRSIAVRQAHSVLTQIKADIFHRLIPPTATRLRLLL